MSQDTFAIANQSRTAYRGSVNAALQALASQSSGASAPATMYAYQIWADTTNGVIKQRNAANSGWIVRATLAETLVVSRSSDTVLALTDFSRTFIATSTFTQTLTAAATLTDGWHCFYRNDGTGVITLDPNASELIDGLATIALQPGESCRISCNGSAFKTTGLTHPRTIVRRKTADESVTSSVTLQDDDHLTFPIAANEEWVVEYDIDCGNALFTTGLKIAITVPSGATLNAVHSLVSDSGSPSAANAITFRTTTSGGNMGWSAAILAGFAACASRVSVWCLNGATPGNVTLQFAQDTSSGTALTFRKGSHLVAHRVA